MRSSKTSEWLVYEPSASEPWDLGRAWTLRRRAGFAATWGELKRDLADGPTRAIDRVLAEEARLDGIPGDFDRVADLLGDASVSSSDIRRLQAWWLYRILFTRDPLQERLTLVWHDHFATSQLKVEDVSAMHRQNQALRALGRGPFGDLLRPMLHDPALLVWLDATANRKGKPNENLARELMELFTLGVGHFSEADVKEAARALTGLAVVKGQGALRAELHDDGEKTVLGKTGNFDADSLADLLLAQPTVADRLAWRLCNTFLGEGVASPAALAGLAEQMRGDGLHVGRAVETILRSRLFFDPKNLRSKVADPVSYVVGTLRAIEGFSPRPPSTLLLAEWTTRVGQDLFFPPNVGGWPGGRGWLGGRFVVARANYAAALTVGSLHLERSAPDLAALAEQRRNVREPHEVLSFYSELLNGRAIERPAADGLWQAASGTGSDQTRLNRAVALLMARPDSYLI